MHSTSTIEIKSWMQDCLKEGFDALSNNNPQKAVACCKKVLEVKPDLVEAHFLVGLVSLAMNDKKTAIRAFGSVTTLDKHHAAAWAHLAKEFIDSGQINRADQALSEAVQHVGNDHLIQNLIGSVFTKLGDYQSAEYWQCKAATQQPDNILYAVNHANNLLYLGKTQAFEKRLDKIFKQAAGHAQTHFLLSTAQKAESDKHIQQIETLVSDKNISAMDSAFLHYAQGKELEDLGEWDRAFTAFEQGAKARRSVIEFDEKAQTDVFAELEQVYTQEWLSSQSGGCEDSSPIFIVGQPRTGTTLVERIISSHSQVHSAGELQQFPMTLRRLLNYREPKWFSADFVRKAAHLDSTAVGDMYLHTSCKMRGTSARFVDKLPSNFYFIPLMLKALPNAKIIHLQRNPMDSCFANYKQLFADAYAHSYDQREMARHYTRYHHLMAVWRERFPGRFFDISYDALVTDLELHSRKLIEYLQLPWEDACLHFHKQDVAVATASTVQVREPAHTRSVGRWKCYEHQLAPMLAVLKNEGVV